MGCKQSGGITHEQWCTATEQQLHQLSGYVRPSLEQTSGECFSWCISVVGYAHAIGDSEKLAPDEKALRFIRKVRERAVNAPFNIVCDPKDSEKLATFTKQWWTEVKQAANEACTFQNPIP